MHLKVKQQASRDAMAVIGVPVATGCLGMGKNAFSFSNEKLSRSQGTCHSWRDFNTLKTSIGANQSEFHAPRATKVGEHHRTHVRVRSSGATPEIFSLCSCTFLHCQLYSHIYPSLLMYSSKNTRFSRSKLRGPPTRLLTQMHLFGRGGIMIRCY